MEKVTTDTVTEEVQCTTPSKELLLIKEVFEPTKSDCRIYLDGIGFVWIFSEKRLTKKLLELVGGAKKLAEKTHAQDNQN